MKPINVFLISSLIVLSIVTYVAMTEKVFQDNDDTTQEDSHRLARPVLPIPETPIDHEVAAKESIQNSALKESVKSLGEQVNHLRAEVALLRQNMVEAQPKLTQLQRNHNPIQNKATLDSVREQMHLAAEKRLQEQGEVLEKNFRQQTTDVNWSEKTKALVENALTDDNVPIKNIIAVECRASMCRVELANDNTHSSPKLSQFPIKVAEELPNILVNQINESDGTISTVLYLSRDEFTSTTSGS